MDPKGSLPFPWTQEDGLAAVLDDGGLWANALVYGHPVERAHQIRRSVKHFLKRTRSGRVDVSDDANFGAAVVEMLRSARSRQRFASELPPLPMPVRNDAGTLASFLGNQLILYLESDAHRRGLIEAVDGEPEDLEARLRSASVDRDRWTIACFAAAKAVLDPRRGRAWAEALLAVGDRFVEYVGLMSPTACRTAIEVVPEPAYEAEARPLGGAEAVDEPEGEVSALIEVLSRYDGWISDLSLAELERALDLLDAVGERPRAARQELAAAQALLDAQIEALPDHPVLQCLRIGLGAALPRTAPVAELLAALERRSAALANARQAADRIDELCQRLDAPRSLPAIPGAVLTGPLDRRFDAVVDLLTRHGDELQAELARVDAAETAADEFLTAWAQLDAGDDLPDSSGRLASTLRLLLGDKLRTARRERLGPVRNDPALLVGLFAYLAIQDRPAACSLLVELVRGPYSEPLLPLLAALDAESLHDLATSSALPAELGELLFVLALRSCRVDLLEDLVSFRGDIAVAELLDVVRRQVRVDDVHGVIRRVVLLARGASGGAVPDSDAEARELRQRLHDRLTLPPGMKRLHAELRSHAQSLLRRDVLTAVEVNQPAAALRAWTALGSQDEMVRAAVARLDAVAARNVTEIHRKNTRTFLAEIERELRDWVVAAAPPASDDGLEAAVRQLAAARRPRSDAVLRVLCGLDDQPACAPLLVVDPRPVLVEAGQHVEPRHTASYIEHCSGRSVPACLYLADRLRVALGRAPVSLTDAVAELLNRRVLHAARRAAADDPALLAVVAAASTARRDALLREHEAALAEARIVMADSDEVAVDLQLFDEAIAAEDFASAQALVADLVNDLQRHRLLQDPERRNALEFLRDDKQSPDPYAPLEQLIRAVESLRAAHAHQRLHVQFLTDACEDPAIGEHVRLLFVPLVRRLDRPSKWPSATQSEALADAIDAVCTYLRTWSEYRAEQPETVGQLLDALPRYISERLQAEPKPRSELLAELVGLMRRAHPPSRILQHIMTLQLPGAEAARPQAPRAPRVAVSVQRESGSDEFAGAIRRYVARIVEQTPAPGPGAPSSVEDALRTKDWPALRRVAAERVRTHGSASSGRNDRLSVLEALFAFASARVDLADPHAARDVTLIYNIVATFWARSSLYQFDLAGEVDSLLVDALDGGPIGRGDVGQRVAELMRSFSGARRDEPTYVWATELMWAASQVSDRDVPASARIAEALWDLLKQQSGPHARTDLLHWLYRLRNDDALRQLANQSPNPSFAVQCIHAFTRAESDVNVRARALQMSAAFRGDQSSRRKNRQPWILLFLRLEQASAHVDGDVPPVHLEALDRLVSDLGDGQFETSLLVEPRLSADPPETLVLRLGDAVTVELISGDEDLLTPRTIQARMRIPERTRAGDLIEVSYVIAGRTFGGRPIEVRGTIGLELAGQIAAPQLRREEILGAWPGASGKPVHHNEGFFGRDGEIREIDRRLRNDRGSGSLMLFGQRRVGKTSLLLEMCRLLAPQPGHVAGVFLDVSSLDLPEHMSMSQRFFAAIVQALGDPRNAAIREALPVNERQMHRLFRGIDPALSLYTALHSLLGRLNEASSGSISRLAFFVDEFDRFVEPLLLGRDVQVDRLMWDLRQIVLQSRDISLILAGSGLQRMLTREYSRPLHGSIEHVEIRPFMWERDRSAILDTFLPESIRGRLCRPENIDVVARHAATMCGGHPYFLSLVGQAAGLSARGRSINVPLVNDAARRLVEARLPELLRIDEQVFYSHIFETLKRVPLRERMLAQILLVHIASRTTETDRWLNISDALEVPDLLRITREAEREAALGLLLDEGAVAQDGGQLLRITVPVTALALRRGATRLRHEAIQQLNSPPGGTA